MQVKDTMHLFGVVNSSPILASKIGIGSGAAAWVIKEFVAKTRAVSKIALLRTTNLATFLEMHGIAQCSLIFLVIVCII